MSDPSVGGWNTLVLTAAITTLSLILGLVLGSMFETGCQGAREAGALFGCIEFLIFRYQTLIAIFTALAVGIVIVQPVWRQLRQLEKQSAIQFYEMLRRHIAIIEGENALVTKAKLEATDALIIEEQIRECISNLSEPSRAVESWAIFSRERYDALNEVIKKLEMARVDKWGDGQDTEVARSRLVIELIKLKDATLKMSGELEAVRLRNFAASNVVTSVWIADKTVLRDLTVAKESSNVERSAIVYSEIVQREIARISLVLARTAKAAME